MALEACLFFSVVLRPLQPRKCVLNVLDARSSLVTVAPYGTAACDSRTCKCDTVQKIKLSLFGKGGGGEKTDSALSRMQTSSVCFLFAAVLDALTEALSKHRS